MALPPFLNSIVCWLRAGYPAGVPDNDYVALIALLSRRLTGDEVAAVATELSRQAGFTDGHAASTDGTGGHTSDPNGVSGQSAPRDGELVDTVDIGVLITKITNELPREEDIARVRSRLAAAGPFI